MTISPSNTDGENSFRMSEQRAAAGVLLRAEEQRAGADALFRAEEHRAAAGALLRAEEQRPGADALFRAEEQRAAAGALLRAEGITKQYGGRTIIRDICIHLNQGELVSLLGLSGSGKTTLFHVLSGLELPEEGHVFLEKDDITGRPGKVSYMLQKDLLLAHKKIIDNVSLPLVLGGMSKKEARQKAAPLFDAFGLEGTQDQYPSQLSGGMRQRAALLRTYLSSSRVALLDEPFSALDSITKSQIHEWYLDVMEKIDLSTLFITHDIDEAILLSDRIYVMTGAPGEILHELRIKPARNQRKEFNLTDEFLNYKRTIIGMLRGE